ncbi:MAG TPA: hypothetical protein VFC67_04685 [Prolixibacteraceae bacterium]|nr:hypothetical protein [Prolixibacteraceae bacterium]
MQQTKYLNSLLLLSDHWEVASLVLIPFLNQKKALTGWKPSRCFMAATQSFALVARKESCWWWQPLNRATASDRETDLNDLQTLALVSRKRKMTAPIVYPKYPGLTSYCPNRPKMTSFPLKTRKLD